MSETPSFPSSVEEFLRSEAEMLAHYAAIGKVAANWAAFENTIDYHTLQLGDFPLAIGHCLTAQVAGSGRKLDAYIAVADYVGASKKTVAALHDFAKNAAGLAEQRNRTVHDPWLLFSAATKDRAVRFEATAKRKLRLILIPVTTAEVEALALKIADLTVRFLDLGRQATGERKPPSPETGELDGEP